MNQHPANPAYVTNTAPPCCPDDADPSTPATTTIPAAAAAASIPPLGQTKQQIALDPAKVRSRNNQLVLAAEDNRVNRRLLTKVLEKAGYKIRMVLNGQECLDYLKRTALWCDDSTLHPKNAATSSEAGKSAGGGGQAEAAEEVEEVEEPSPVIILMDYAMPVMNGADATRRIREWEREGRLARSLPIVSMNAGSAVHHGLCSSKNPADDTVRKPVRLGELVEKVDEWVERYESDGRNGVDVGEFARLSIGVNCG